MIDTSQVADAVAACGMGVISGGIWLGYGAPTGLIAFGLSMVLVAAAASADEDDTNDNT